MEIENHNKVLELTPGSYPTYSESTLAGAVQHRRYVFTNYSPRGEL